MHESNALMAHRVVSKASVKEGHRNRANFDSLNHRITSNRIR